MRQPRTFRSCTSNRKRQTWGTLHSNSLQTRTRIYRSKYLLAKAFLKDIRSTKMQNMPKRYRPTVVSQFKMPVVWESLKIPAPNPSQFYPFIAEYFVVTPDIAGFAVYP